MRYNLLILILLMYVMTAQSWAADLVTFDFTSNKSVTYKDSQINSAVYDGSRLSNSNVVDDGFGNVLTAYPAAGSTSLATAITNDSYFTITITPEAGKVVSLNQLVFEVGKGGAASPRGYAVRSSADSYTTNILSETFPGGAAVAPAERTVSLAGHQKLTTVTFRFYIFSPTPNSNSVDFRNFVFRGTAAVYIPTLSEWGVIIFSILLGIIAIWTINRKKGLLIDPLQ